MKTPFLSMCAILACLALAGCSTSSLLNGSRGPNAAAVPAGRNLAMPPDLQLPAPGSGPVAAYQPAVPEAGYGTAAATPPADESVYGGAAPVTPRRTVGGTQCKNGTQAPDIYGCYNISKLTPDGKKKTQAQLSSELRVALLEEKRRANPNYGTFKNVGELFN